MIQINLFSIGLEFYNDQISRRPSNKDHKILCENRISFLIDSGFYFFYLEILFYFSSLVQDVLLSINKVI